MSISIKELMKQNGANIIDIRTKESYNNRHINGSVNIFVNELYLRPEKYLQKGKKYYIYCQRGNSSKRLCQFLMLKGYNAVNIIGGYEAWVMSNLSKTE